MSGLRLRPAWVPAQIPGLAAAVDRFWEHGTTGSVAALLEGGAKDRRAAAVALLSVKVAAVAWPSVRDVYASRAVVQAAAAKQVAKKEGSKEASKGASYVGFEAAVARLRPHQTLALSRGKHRGALAVAVALPDPTAATHAADREVRLGCS